MCGGIGGSGDTGSQRNVELVAMQDLEFDVEMAMEDVELVEDVELDGDMESWVGLVLLDSAYWRLQQQDEEEVLAWVERRAKWVESLRKGRYIRSQRRCLRSGQDYW